MSRFYCPKCNARLDKQPDFDPNAEDIICAKCGHSYFGILPDSEKPDENVEYVSFEDADTAETAHEEIAEEPVNTRKTRRSRVRRTENGKKKKWRLYLILAAVVVIAVAALLIYNHARKLIRVGISSEEAKGANYEKVVTQLVKSGFKNIRTEALGDLKGTAMSDQDLIEEVMIDGDLVFYADSKYTYDSLVKISYHSVKMVSAPMSSREAKGQDYKAVVEKFENAGFEDVELEPDYDLVVGWFAKPNEVEVIRIGEKEKFKEDEEFKYNDKVLIRYHAFPDTKPKSSQNTQSSQKAQ